MGHACTRPRPRRTRGQEVVMTTPETALRSGPQKKQESRKARLPMSPLLLPFKPSSSFSYTTPIPIPPHHHNSHRLLLFLLLLPLLSLDSQRLAPSRSPRPRFANGKHLYSTLALGHASHQQACPSTPPLRPPLPIPCSRVGTKICGSRYVRGVGKKRKELAAAAASLPFTCPPFPACHPLP